MNNTAFRRLVLDTPSRSNGAQAQEEPRPTVALGSRMRSSIPMTPRSLGGSSSNDFARQLADRNAELNPNLVKKFRSSAAPKGTKLAEGYQDRTKLRNENGDDGKAERVQALEDMVKLGQMDENTFQKLRDEIVGGDIENVHLVKGLDFKLLRRIRDGSDTTEDIAKNAEPEARALTEIELEEELGKVESQTIAPVSKEERIKQGVMAPPPSRNRDEILKNLRAARNVSAKEKKELQSSLGSRFKKLGEKRESSRIERDEHGREVLILVAADGTIKRKVKKAPGGTDASAGRTALPVPDKNIAPLGMEAPELRKIPTPPPAEELDIFDGVGTDFNPLGDDNPVDDDESSSDSSSVTDNDHGDDTTVQPVSEEVKSKTSAESSTGQPGRSRNYFDEEPKVQENTEQSGTMVDDPIIRAALKRAADIQAKLAGSSNESEQDEKLQRRKRLLETHDRDAEDMDLGFGGSRLADDENFEDGKRVKLSVWGEDKKGGQESNKGAKQPRKRGPKKKPADGKNMADVMRVIERRKGQA